MMAFGLMFTATVATVVQRIATQRSVASHPFDVFIDTPRALPSPAGRPTQSAIQDPPLDCRPDRPAFRLGSPFRHRSRERDLEIVPGPTIPDIAPQVRPL